MNVNSITVREEDGGLRNFINGKKLAHFVWNHYNPDQPIKKGYLIHHKDKDTLNDHISNLELMSIGNHSILHHTGRKCSEKTKQKMSLSSIGRIFSDEHKMNLSKSHKGKKHSEETKRKMSSSGKNKIVSDETKRKISEALKGHVVTKEARDKMSKSHKKGAYNGQS